MNLNRELVKTVYIVKDKDGNAQTMVTNPIRAVELVAKLVNGSIEKVVVRV